MNTRTARNKQGFTLVELMVVAIIVAILAAVAIPLMSGNKARAIATEAESGCGTVQTALRVHKAEHSVFPTLSSGSSVTNLPGIGATDLDGTYFDTSDYSVESAAASYTITCAGGGSSAPKSADANGITVTLDEDGAWTRTGL